MTLPDTASLSQSVATFVGAVLILAFMLQKGMNTWKSGKAEGSVLDLMHSELERMSQQNTLLSKELGKLQLDIIALNKNLRGLSSENQRLHHEVNMLTEEVNRLQTVLTRSQT